MNEHRSNYVVLARKYRPKKLEHLIGQSEILSILKGAFMLNRLSHAYLLSGTRGVGKTTLARILAKVVNCLDENSFAIGEPCNKCKNCMSIDAENNIDVIEIDAASKTGVSDVREIIENIKFRPVSALKKVYIIDEVHMLSKAAFNALLKTLEEPPLDVLFILATTETEKVPVTIISRCQHFIFKRFSTDELTDHLIEISQLENIKLDNISANLISKSSEGSVRDALSLLDSLISRSTKIDRQLVENVLCMQNILSVAKLFEHICNGDVEKAILEVDKFYLNGCSFELLAKDLLDMTYQIARLKTTKKNTVESITEFELKTYKKFSEMLDMDVLIRIYEVMHKYFEELSNSFDQKKSFEMTIIRLCYIILIPSPFEKVKTKSVEENDVKENSNPNNEKLLDHFESNLVIKSSNLQETSIQKDNYKCEDASKFKNLVDKIEKEGDLIIAHKLRNNFKLVRINDANGSKPSELELDNYKNIEISSAKLWNLSKLLEKLTKKRWIVSISREKGAETLNDIKIRETNNMIEKISNQKNVKKLLEIIPNSKVTSINKNGVKNE